MREAIRIDKLLFFLRLTKSRTLALSWAEHGHIRVNGQRIEKGSFLIHVGDVITLPKGEDVIAVRLDVMPSRRGPAIEAYACYQLLK